MYFGNWNAKTVSEGAVCKHTQTSVLYSLSNEALHSTAGLRGKHFGWPVCFITRDTWQMNC